MTLADFLLSNPTLPVILLSAFVAYRSYLSQTRLAKAKHSIEFQSDYHSSQQLQTALESTRSLIRNAMSDEIAALATQQAYLQESSKNIREILNTWERVAIAIKKDIYDEDVLYQAYGTSVISLWVALRPFVRGRQSINPLLYVNFDWLAVKWQIKRSNLKSRQATLKRAEKILSEL